MPPKSTPGRRSEPADRSPRAQGDVALTSFGERRHEDRKRCRRDRRGSETLQRAKGDEDSSLQARPQRSDPTVNRIVPNMKMRRRPSRSADRPPSRRNPPKTSA